MGELVMKQHPYILFPVVIFVMILGLSFTTGVGAWSVPDTGQTTCYNDTESIPCPNPGTAFYGQDAHYILHSPSYTKMGHGGTLLPESAVPADGWIMTKDNVTGLTWEVKQNSDGMENYNDANDSDNTYAGYNADPGTGAELAQDFINALNAGAYGGYTDWRLPDISELNSLFVYMDDEISISTLYFPNTRMDWYYWSSTPFADNQNDAWLAAFNYGFGMNLDKEIPCHVRAVRGATASSAFINNGDGTVSDSATGLMWQQETAPGDYTWRMALDHCETMVLAGYTDWRLPTIKEIRMLVDRNQYAPAIDTTVFPGTLESYYWSATTICETPVGAWCLDFYDGNEYGSEKTDRLYVRAVRNEQSALFSNTLSIIPDQRQVSATAGTTTFDISNTGTGTMNWSVQIISGEDWLSIASDVAGTNSGVVICEFETNPDPSPRTGLIRVTASDAGNSPGEMTVIQAGAFPSSSLSPVVEGLRVLAAMNADFHDASVDADQNGKIEMADVVQNLMSRSGSAPQNSYEINSGGRFELWDDISGATIIFPNGGAGTLTIKKIADDPEVAPLDGISFMFEFTGDDDIQMSYPRSGEAEPLVWIYGVPKNPVDFSIDKDAQWMPLPPVDETSMPAVFDLYHPGDPVVKTRAASSFKTVKAFNRPPHSYSMYYQNTMKVNNWAWKRNAALWDITKKTIADIWNILPASVQAQKQSDYTTGLKPKGAYSGWSSGYIGFKYLAGLIRVRDPHFWYSVYNGDEETGLDAEAPSQKAVAIVAHESGHYISHLILGDDQYIKLEAQKKDPHDLADVHVNRDMLEEYAFFGRLF
jgi:hypothetical protein